MSATQEAEAMLWTAQRKLIKEVQKRECYGVKEALLNGTRSDAAAAANYYTEVGIIVDRAMSRAIVSLRDKE